MRRSWFSKDEECFRWVRGSLGRWVIALAKPQCRMVMRLSAPVLGTAEGKGEGRQERKVLPFDSGSQHWLHMRITRSFTGVLHPTPDRKGVQAPRVSKACVFQ